MICICDFEMINSPVVVGAVVEAGKIAVFEAIKVAAAFAESMKNAEKKKD